MTSVRNILVFLTFLDPNPKNTFSNGVFKKDEKRTIKDEKRTRTDQKRTRKDKKGQGKDKKGRKKDKKGREMDKGFIFADLSQKGQKDNKRQKTPRVSPWGFIPVRNILVFFYFYKENEKSSF